MEEIDSTQVATLGGAAFEVRPLLIQIASGPDAGTTREVDLPTFVIGSGSSADLVLNDATVSREHCRLSLGSEGVRLCDSGSKNGTFISGNRVADVHLLCDTTVLVGKTRLELFFRSGTRRIDVTSPGMFGDAVGVSPAMRHVFALLSRIADSNLSVLLEGETGVGKEVLARAIHKLSRRAAGPFVVVDCAAIPAQLLEAELFGHERGAFTGALEARDGLFEQADGGTVFIDELGELPHELQPKLLRVLERREVRRVGGRQVRELDVRVVSATHRDLRTAASEGKFREDLYYRLAGFRARVPPLRDRPDDILPLARHLYRVATGNAEATLPAELAVLLVRHDWPGNVRELKSVVERFVALGAADAGLLLDVPERQAPETSPVEYAQARRDAIQRFEREYAQRLLDQAEGNVALAAKSSRLARPSFYRLMQRAGIDLGDSSRR